MKKRIEKILCPTDFSETADQAIAYAGKLCKEIGAELTLLNVQSIFSLPPTEVIKGKYLATEPIQDQLEEQSYQVMNAFKIACYTEVAPSNRSLSDIIADRARDFDMIVMGTRGADDYYQFFFGSNSYQVARASSVPVLLIPEGCAYTDISTLVYGFDYETEHHVPMNQVSQWIELLDIKKTTVLQVKDHFDRLTELTTKEVEENNKRFSDSMGVTFETIFSDDVVNTLHHYVTSHKADALALCVLNRGIIGSLFHKSVIKALSSTVNYPLFIFHE